MTALTIHDSIALPGIQQFRLDGRVAMVTGGSKGLGLAMAAGLASAGAKVLLVSRNGEQALAAAAAIAEHYAVEDPGELGSSRHFDQQCGDQYPRPHRRTDSRAIRSSHPHQCAWHLDRLSRSSSSHEASRFWADH